MDGITQQTVDSGRKRTGRGKLGCAEDTSSIGLGAARKEAPESNDGGKPQAGVFKDMGEGGMEPKRSGREMIKK